MRARLPSYLGPAAAGAIVAFLVRLIFGNLQVALVGVFAFLVVLGAIVLIARMMKWEEAPMAYSAIAAIAVTVSFLLRRLA
ncbi:MAG: hypothetical protein WBA68_13250 [Alteraurantiacibacter sp.]